ncbi:HET-domain-containing protein [Viridothelium virens]|uniref:HET-domain-containing protein n=1 Tax=Viridothelium virens TaxID=1048519 RepID=A0A6A6GV81_VIRVR|nr:HET-domain-containing protein [Viridothelium virens]
MSHPSDFYSSLGGKSNIRCLLLEPGSGNEPLVGHLVVRPIDSGPPYDALSYTWGDPEKTESILCNDAVRIGVTANLGKALHRVRLPSEVRHVWVDQVCINQNDIRERNAQVMIMGQIYQSARAVLVYLGGSAEDGVDAAALVKLVNEAIDEEEASTKVAYFNLPRRSSPGSIFADLRWKAFDKALRSPWFRRLWIVQEVGLGADVKCLFGESEIDWILFCRAYHFRYMVNSEDRPDFISEGLLNSAGGWLMEGPRPKSEFAPDWRKVSKQADFSFLPFLIEVNGHATSDPRDHIYAMYGHPLARVDGSFIMEPDYSLTKEETYVNFARAWATKTKDLRLLSFVEHDSTSVVDSFSSWVPRWDIPRKTQVMSTNLHKNFLHQAGGTSSPVFEVVDELLIVNGIMFDKISKCSEVMETERTSEQAILQLWRYMVSDRSEASSDQVRYFDDKAYMTPKPNPIGTFALTITAGRRGNEFVGRDGNAYVLELMDKTAMSATADRAILKEHSKGGSSVIFKRLLARYSKGRTLFYTEGGLAGLGPAVVQPGDICCILLGVENPYILRKTGDRSIYTSQGGYDFDRLEYFATNIGC